MQRLTEFCLGWAMTLIAAGVLIVGVVAIAATINHTMIYGMSMSAFALGCIAAGVIAGAILGVAIGLSMVLAATGSVPSEGEKRL